ncbi:hypothetical protein L7F22_008480 [Adiantum nelumboides]|nr:hypothetical protein [Adiantum nelumboides]
MYISGADTYRIHSAEMIVGALPDLGLGQGWYVIDYTREDERLVGYSSRMTYASSIGHVVPNYRLALEKGLSGLVAEVKQLNASTDASKIEFYNGQLAEHANPEEIAACLRHLTSASPHLHPCLHLTGERTDIDRLDQLFLPFYTADIAIEKLDDDQAQVIIDCFWIKLGETVQLNRFYVEDHQPYGNLAFGGASGSYPQGAGNNQWIQHNTVGGTIQR